MNRNQPFLEEIYQNLKWSRLGDIYRYFFHKSHRYSIKHEIKFLNSFFPKEPVVFDIGGNAGHKTYIFLTMGAKKVIIAEPDPFCLAILRKRFGNRKRVHIVDKGIDNIVGKAAMFVAEEGDPYNTLSQKWVDSFKNSSRLKNRANKTFEKSRTILTTTLDELIVIFGKPDVIKLDIEGYELNALQGLHQAIGFIWFETNLPEFRNETQSCIEHLLQLAPCYEFNYSINVSEGKEIKLELSSWTDGATLIKLVKETSYRFMEIFARLPEKTTSSLPRECPTHPE